MPLPPETQDALSPLREGNVQSRKRQLTDCLPWRCSVASGVAAWLVLSGIIYALLTNESSALSAKADSGLKNVIDEDMRSIADRRGTLSAIDVGGSVLSEAAQQTLLQAFGGRKLGSQDNDVQGSSATTKLLLQMEARLAALENERNLADKDMKQKDLKLQKLQETALELEMKLKQRTAPSLVAAPREASPRYQGDMPAGKIGVNVCASKEFVEWQDEDAGIIKLLPQRGEGDDGSEGAMLCPMENVRYRCADAGQFTDRVLGRPLSFLEARKIALAPHGRNLKRALAEAAHANWNLSTTTSVPSSGGRRNYFQVAEHLADTSTRATQTHRPCLSVVFDCVSPRMCQSGISETDCQNQGGLNMLLRFPRSDRAKALMSQPSKLWQMFTKGNQSSRSDAPNILVLSVDSLSRADFHRDFNRTNAVLDKLRRTGVPERYASVGKKKDRLIFGNRSATDNERVVDVSDNNAMGVQTHVNHPQFLMGKGPVRCNNAFHPEFAQGTAPRAKDQSEVRKAHQKIEKRSLTTQTGRNAFYQSHLLKVAKDNGFTLSATQHPSEGLYDLSCTGIETELDMTRGIHIIDPETGKMSSEKTAVADVFQWAWYLKSFPNFKITTLAGMQLEGSQGCTAQSNEIDYTVRFVTSLLETSSQSPARAHPGPVFGFAQINGAHQPDWTTGSIEYLDLRLSQLLENLFETGVLEDTVVAIWGDHGLGFSTPNVDRARLMKEILRPAMIYILPPSKSLMKEKAIGDEEETKNNSSSISTSSRRGSTSPPSENKEESTTARAPTVGGSGGPPYDQFLRHQLGRRSLASESKVAFRNMVNNNGMNMRMTQLDHYATIVNLIASGVKGKSDNSQPRPLLHNSNGVVDFARSMTHDYKSNLRHEWIKGKSYYEVTELEKEQRYQGRAGILQRILRPTCPEMGIFTHNCRHYKDEEVVNHKSTNGSTALSFPSSTVEKGLQRALRSYLSTMVNYNKIHVPPCNRWSSIDLDRWKITQVSKRIFESRAEDPSEEYLFVVFFDVTIPRGLQPATPGGSTARTVTFTAKSTVRRGPKKAHSKKWSKYSSSSSFSASSSSSSSSSSSIFSVLQNMMVDSMKRLSTYAEDENTCGQRATDWVNKRRGSNLPMWEQMKYCACDINPGGARSSTSKDDSVDPLKGNDERLRLQGETLEERNEEDHEAPLTT